MTFEESLARIDEIVGKLSDGGTTLEEALALYAEGTKLLGACTRQLGEARVRLETLSPQREDAE